MSVPGHKLERMFNPKTTVVIGDKGPNYMWLKNNQPFQEKGGNLYSVQIDESEIKGIEELGFKNYTSLADIPEPIDYAIVAVPRHISPYVLNDLIDAKAASAAFFTSGFAETNEELGIALQKQLTEAAKTANFNVIGPNCMGLYLPKAGIRFSPDVPIADDGVVSFLSQSGTHGIMFSLVMASQGMHLSKCVSFGNAIVLDISDYLEYLIEDPETKIIGLYVEGVKDGARFVRTLKEACRHKPVVVWKGGQTEAGALATKSHTASLASPEPIWEGIMKQCGAISTTSLDETVDVVKLLLNSKPTMGRNLGLMAMTGGQSVSITDAFCKVGFDVPALSEQSYEELGSFFNIVGGSYRNPLDMAGTLQGNTETLKRILTILDADPKIDALIMEQSAMFGARQWRNKPEVLDAMLDTLVEHRNNSQKPFFIVMHPAHEEAFVVEIRQKFAKQKIAVFPNFERAATAAKLALPYCLAI
jgi:acyl-CoA synthetase (NDP forming)